MAEIRLDEVVANHTRAMGGRAAIERRRRVDVDIEVHEASFSGVVRYRGTRDGSVRVDVSIGGERVFSEGIDAGGPWQMGADREIRPVGEAGTAALRQGLELHLHGIHEYPARGHEIALGDPLLIADVDHVVLDVGFSFGPATRLLLHPETWLVERRRDVRALHPELDPARRRLETVVTAFTPLCDVPWPAASRQVDVDSGQVLQESRLRRWDCDRSGDVAELARPG